MKATKSNPPNRDSLHTSRFSSDPSCNTIRFAILYTKQINKYIRVYIYIYVYIHVDIRIYTLCHSKEPSGYLRAPPVQERQVRTENARSMDVARLEALVLPARPQKTTGRGCFCKLEVLEKGVIGLQKGVWTC